MSDLNGSRFKPQTSSSRDQRVTAPKIGRCLKIIQEYHEIKIWTAAKLVEWLRVHLWNGRSEVQISASQIGHNIANGSPPQQHFSEKICVVPEQ